ncbi:hypothetical protein BU17DRAFT_91688 [Hysterangium stoloniferum]|nr:hypothetical protein BU17DRAFT_91688 [Hysterangium stoloniferum]
MTCPSQKHILLPSNEIKALIGLSEHNAKQITNGGVPKIHSNVVDIVSNRHRNTLTRNSTGPILNTFERPPFVGNVTHRKSSRNTSHQPSGPQPGTFNDPPQGMVNNYMLHEESDNLSISLPGLIANEYNSGNYSLSPILGIGSHNNAMDAYNELRHADCSIAVPPASTGGLPDLQDYSTVELPPLSYSTPDAQESAIVATASKAAIPVLTPSVRSPRNGGPPMQNHTIAPIPAHCPSQEYHELYLGNNLCSCGLSLKSRPSKVEKGFMCVECCVPFTTYKNGIRHARNAKKIHKCPTCHEYFARIDYCNSHKKICSGKKGEGFSRGV